MLFVQVPILGTNSDPTLWTFTSKCELYIKGIVFENNEQNLLILLIYIHYSNRLGQQEKPVTRVTRKFW